MEPNLISHQARQKELSALKTRDKELDVLFELIYEDNVCGKISDDRFAKMSVKYETEQKEIQIKIKELETEINATKKQISHK